MVDVSIIIPVYNAENWLDECLESVYNQSLSGISMEISFYNDCSSDKSFDIIKKWIEKLESKDFKVVISSGKDSSPGGSGFAKNRAILQSSGKYICILDADDIMESDRVFESLKAIKQFDNTIVGSKFRRIPEGSTCRYTKWANSLTQEQLYSQRFTSHGPTILIPTWIFPRYIFDKVGGFDESGKGTPEDLLFFNKHLRLGGKLFRIDKELLTYRYHPEATTFSVKESTIWDIRVKAIQEDVLSHWSSFSVWNAGKQGRKFFRSLDKENQKKVIMFVDVDEKKISKKFYIFEESKEIPKPKIPILHFTKLKPPVIICMKLDLTNGVFEDNLNSLNLNEGVDYYHFN